MVFWVGPLAYMAHHTESYKRELLVFAAENAAPVSRAAAAADSMAPSMVPASRAAMSLPQKRIGMLLQFVPHMRLGPVHIASAQLDL